MLKGGPWERPWPLRPLVIGPRQPGRELIRRRRIRRLRRYLEFLKGNFRISYYDPAGLEAEEKDNEGVAREIQRASDSTGEKHQKKTEESRKVPVKKQHLPKRKP